MTDETPRATQKVLALPDLDLLERLARVATPGPWRCEVGGFEARQGGNVLTSAPVAESWSGSRHTVICISHVFYERHAEDFAHMAANSPDVTLALIARIRELTSEASQLATQRDLYAQLHRSAERAYAELSKAREQERDPTRL